MSEHQLAFVPMLVDADQREHARRDQHRANVQQLFDELTPHQKQQLAAWMMEHEWDTCAALSAAAGDWYETNAKEEGPCMVCPSTS